MKLFWASLSPQVTQSRRGLEDDLQEIDCPRAQGKEEMRYEMIKEIIDNTLAEYEAGRGARVRGPNKDFV